VSYLSPKQMVSVNLPTIMPVTLGRHSDVIDFRVVAVIDSIVALEPLERVQHRNLPARIRDCYVTFGVGPRLTAFKGHLYQRPPGDWRFKVTDLTAPLGESDFRIRVCAPISIAPYDGRGAGETLETETVNFGIAGALVDGDTGRSPAERVSLSLSLIGEDEPVQTLARLVSRQGALWNFKYEAMSVDTRNRLRSFIIDYQRDMLRLQKARYKAEFAGVDDELDL
jgi:hypothetical protein